MKRIFLAILLDVVALVGVFTFLGFPVDGMPVLREARLMALCSPGETLRTRDYSTMGQDGRTAYRTDFYCRDKAGQEREVTERAIVLTILMFLIPFPVSMFLFISGGNRLKKSLKQKRGVDDIDAGEGSRTGRLRELKAAYEQGLITESEYERKREEILREM